jgi:hypothetical protein
VLTPLLISAAQPVFKNPKAREARAGYEEDLRKAENEFNAKVLAAKRNYRLRLDQSKAPAMRAGDLDDANNIAAELKQLDQEINDYKERPANISRGLVVRKAMHGIGEQWVDVTDLLRNRISNEVLNLDDLPDPAVGRSKTTVVEGFYGGREFVLSFNDGGGDPRKTLVFGQPSEKVKTGR